MSSEDIKKLINRHQRRLQKLQERQASQGINTPPEVLIEIEDIERDLGKLRGQLEAQQTQFQQMLDLAPSEDAQIRQPIEQRLAEIERLLAEINTAKPTTFDQQKQDVNTQYNAGRDIYTGPVYQGIPPPPTLDPTTALGQYLSHVIEANRRLQLQGIRSAGQLVSIELEQVYITLTATTRQRVTTEEEWLAEAAKLAPGESHRRIAQPRSATRVVKVQQALADYPRLVVVGDPGSGKTTLLRYLALTYARDLAGQTGLVKKRLNLEEQRLPILLPLREFARYLTTHHPDASLDGPKLLLDYLRTYFANQDIPLPERFFADRLQAGECTVLLDGVDEVARLETRHRIARITERFTITYPKNRMVVTSRLVGYSGAARLGEDYVVTRVRDFSENDIHNFVSHWNLAVELTLAQADTPEARRQARQQSEALIEAIQHNERVRELAVNPLLLTVIALVQRYRAQLPERRTELYEEAIEVLLGQWDVAKGLSETTYLGGRELDAGDRRSLLEPIALWMMEQQLREIETTDLHGQLIQQFTTMISDPHQVGKAVDGFIRLISERSGLLNERGHGVYSFSHLTFQEHLAARAVADRDDYVDYTLTRLADSWWREVILLEAGYLSTQGKRRGTALIKAIMEHPKESVLFHNLVLAAECVRDVGTARIEGDLATEIQQRIRREFAQPLKKDDRETIKRRAAAAEALARIESGSSGLQPAFWRLPYGEPVWITIPAGEFWMGSEDISEDEKPLHRVYLDEYQIARVPVTNAQYSLFIEATNHKPRSGWTAHQSPKGKESHPVVNVNWYDALAYCDWLSNVTGKAIVLPSEAQWEKAARGDQDQRAYPWGDEWDKIYCNIDELRLGDTTPVGIFQEGASPYGCLDMAGNVWEWCSSLYKAYPYEETDDREELEVGTDVIRVVRGGSWNFNRYDVPCAIRYRYFPISRNVNQGFRVLVAHAPG